MRAEAQLADALKPPAHQQEGYVAQRHDLRPDLLLVWAPCGCYWIGSNKQDYFVTMCGTKTCAYSWMETQKALDALQRAEESLKCTTAVEVPELVKPAQASSTPASTPTVTNMETTASAPQTSPVVDTATTTATHTALDQLIDQMISEGGPVDPAVPEVPEEVE